MVRKLVLLATVLAAAALAAPGMAAASPALTSPAKVLTPLGTGVRAASTNWLLTTAALGPFPCSEVEFGATVAENSGSSIRLAPGGTGTTQGCSFQKLPVIYWELTLEELNIDESGKGTASLSFKVPLGAGGVVCSYAAEEVPFVYVPGSNVVDFSKASLSVEPVLCGPASFDGEFSLTNLSGEPLIID